MSAPSNLPRPAAPFESKSRGNNIGELIEIMRRLRDPNTGCPWDVEQTFATIAPYTIEEAYEVADAIARGKAAERAASHKTATGPPSVLDGLPAGLPALKQAEKFQKRAARVGFDWTEAKDVIGKIQEELDEVRAEFGPQGEPTSIARLSDEVGDLLFACVNLARKAGIDPGMALRGTNLKFERRFRRVETVLAADGRTPSDASLEEMEGLWVQAKQEERATAS